MVVLFFDCFFDELTGISIWRMSAFLITEHGNLDFALFFIAFLRRVHLLNICVFLLFLGVFVSPFSSLASGAWVILLVMFGHARRKS